MSSRDRCILLQLLTWNLKAFSHSIFLTKPRTYFKFYSCNPRPSCGRYLKNSRGGGGADTELAVVAVLGESDDLFYVRSDDYM